MTKDGYAGSYITFDDFIVKEANGGLPSAVTDFTASSDPSGVKKASLQFTAPSVNVLGEDLAELSDIKIYVDGVLNTTIDNPVKGQTYNQDIYISVAGSLEVTVIPENSHGAGSLSTTIVNVGGELPGREVDYEYSPQVSGHHKVLAVYSPTGVTVTWDPTEGAAGYKVTAYPAGTVLAENTAELTATDTGAWPTEPALRWYQIDALNADGSVKETKKSNIVSINNTVPFSFAATTDSQVVQGTGYVTGAFTASFWQIYSRNEQKMLGTSVNRGTETQPYATRYVLPAANLEKGKFYRLDAYISVESSPVTVTASAGRTNGVNDREVEIFSDMHAAGLSKEYEDGQDLSAYFQVPEGGNWFVGLDFVSNNDVGAYTNIHRVSITEVGPDLPGTITESSVVFDPNDRTKATVSFKAPEKIWPARPSRLSTKS